MAEDVSALERMRPGGKPASDRQDAEGRRRSKTRRHDAQKRCSLPVNTKGCTTWTFSVTDGGRSYNVVIIGSVGVNPGFILVNNKDNPQIADEYQRSFKVLRSLKPDIPLGSHPAMYNLAEKLSQDRPKPESVHRSRRPT